MEEFFADWEPVDDVEDVPSAEMRTLIRIGRDAFYDLVGDIKDYLPIANRVGAFTAEKRVFTALRFFTSGSYLADIALHGCMHNTSASRCLRDVVEAMNSTRILQKFIAMPQSIEELQQLREQFRIATGIPGAVGLIDCTHIPIVAPKTSDRDRPEGAYVNRKGQHTVNTQMICDHEDRVRSVAARYPGSSHDQYIWDNSLVAAHLRGFAASNPEEAFFLMGDRGYALERCLLTSVKSPRTAPERNFNRRFSRVRSSIERTFGAIKPSFRCVNKQRILHYAPQKAGNIINACVVLHNLKLEERMGGDDVEEAHPRPVLINPDIQANNHADGTALRNRIISDYFV